MSSVQSAVIVRFISVISESSFLPLPQLSCPEATAHLISALVSTALLLMVTPVLCLCVYMAHMDSLRRA